MRDRQCNDPEPHPAHPNGYSYVEGPRRCPGVQEKPVTPKPEELDRAS